MNALSSDERLPLYQRLRDELARQIANNRWRPGEAIPTEAVLAGEYQLSIGTVRKAIDKLVEFLGIKAQLVFGEHAPRDFVLMLPYIATVLGIWISARLRGGALLSAIEMRDG